MKRNSKFLLMLSLLICIMGVYMVGCDDTTVERPTVVADKVVGSIEGVILDKYMHEPPTGIIDVVFWSEAEERDSVQTEADGSFLIPEPLNSGTYYLMVKVRGYESESGYTTAYYTAYIPTVTELKGDIDVNPSGEIHYRASFIDDCGNDNCLGSILLFNKCASVRGQLWSALPEGEVAPVKDQSDQALDGPISPIGGVNVILTYPKDCGVVPLKWKVVTDIHGFYTFTGLPEYDEEIALTIPPFAYGDSSYQQFDTTIYLVNCEPITVPDVYGIVDCRSIPTVLSYNFGSSLPFNYSANLVMNFSEPMDTATFDFYLYDNYEHENVSLTYSWNQATEGGSGDSILTIDPYLTLATDRSYSLYIDEARSKSGCMLASEFDQLSFTTQDGIALFATNAETTPGNFTDFQIENDITLTFTMPPVLDPFYSVLTLIDITEEIHYEVAFVSSINGNVISINPSDSLEFKHTYEVCYKVFSSIPGDFDEGCFEFQTEVDPNPINEAPQNFRLANQVDTLVDWNTKSFTLRWDKVDRAIEYFIYARDDANERPNTDWIKVATIQAKEYLQYMEESITLPAQFDRFKGDEIQTPFSDTTHVWFTVRARNDAGSGPLATALEFYDNVPPGSGNGLAGNGLVGGNNSISFSQISGSGDNTTGSVEVMVRLNLDDSLEYMDPTSPTWDFVEAGGNESYVLPEANGYWGWNNSSRNNDPDSAYFMVPAGACAAGDELWLTFKDNSGNETDPIQINLDLVRPYFTYAAPLLGDTVEAPDYSVNYTITQAPGVAAITWVDYWLTLDDGVTLIDSTEDFSNDGSQSSGLRDNWMSDNLARVGLQDADGGVIWWSDHFMVSGIQFSDTAAIHAWDASTVYDELGTDSTFIPLTWTSVGIESLYVTYMMGDSLADLSFTSWSVWAGDYYGDTVIENTGSFNWYPPNDGGDYRTWIVLTDNDGDDRPWEHTYTGIDITNDWVNIVDPSNTEDIEGGADYDITWTLVGELTQMVIIEVSYAGNVDSMFAPIATTENDGLYTWAVPSTSPSTTTWMRFRDSNDSNTLDIVGPFNVTGLSVTAPVSDDVWLVDSGKNITWDCADTAAVGDVRIWWSTDGFTTDSTEITTDSTHNDLSYTWGVDATPSTSMQIRIWGILQDVYTTSDVFTLAGVTVTAPNGGGTWAVGSSVTITWDTTSTTDTISTVEIRYTYDGGSWNHVTYTANDGSFTWDEVPNFTSDGLAKVLVRDSVTTLGSDDSDTPFDIAGVIINHPNGGETLVNGITYNITWAKVATISNPLKIEYSLNGISGDYFPITASVNASNETFAWTLNALSDLNLIESNNCWVKISETGTGTIWDKSNTSFTISNQPPVADAGVDQTAVSANVSWVATATDPDGGIMPAISSVWNGAAPTGSFIPTNNGDGTMTFAYTYDAADAGITFIREFTANDGIDIHMDAVNLIVQAAPVVGDIQDQTVTGPAAFATIDLDALVADADNTDAELTWTATGGTDVSIAIDGSHIATITYTGGWTGNETITFIAEDPDGNTDSDTATFTVD